MCYTINKWVRVELGTLSFVETEWHLKAHVTRDILTHNIAVKRYFDKKKNIFEPMISIDQGKA